MTTQTYTVTGMTCGHCVASVTEEVSELDGVGDVDVDARDRRPAVTARPGRRRRRRRVRAAVEEAGRSTPRPLPEPRTARPPRQPRHRLRDRRRGRPHHRPRHHRDDLRVLREPDRAQAQQGRRASPPAVNYATEKARVQHAPGVPVEDLLRTRPRGPGTTPPSRSHRVGRTRHEAADADRGRGPAPPVLVAAPHGAGHRRCSWRRRGSSPAGSAVAARARDPRSWRGAACPSTAPPLVNARHGATTMDTLVSLGVLAAYLWSVFALARTRRDRHDARVHADRRPWGHAHYLPRGRRGVTTFLLAGRYVEARAKRRAGAALRSLLELGAKDVAVLPDGPTAPEQRVPVDRLAVGDPLRRSPRGEGRDRRRRRRRAVGVDPPADRRESCRVEVGVGDDVAGATVNVGGRLVVRASAVGADTQLAQIARLVERRPDRQGGRAAAGRPGLRGVRARRARHRHGHPGGWLLHRRPVEPPCSAAVAVLIIACPCALGPGHADRPARRHRPRRPARHPDPRPRGAGVHPPRRHRRARQDRHGHHRRGCRSSTWSPPATGDEAAAARPGRRGRARLRAPRRPGGRRARPHRGDLPSRRRLREPPRPRRRGTRRGDGAAHDVVVGRPALLADRGVAVPPTSTARRRRAARPAARSSPSAGRAACRASCSSMADTVKPDVRRGRRRAACPRARAGAAHRRPRGVARRVAADGRHRHGRRRRAARGQGRRGRRGCRRRAASSRWSATASTTPRRWPRPTSGWPWAPAPTPPSRPPT